MTERDWASTRRRRWSAARVAAAAALHVLVLLSLTLAIDRVELPRHGLDRVTTLVTITLHAASPPVHALPVPVPLARARAPSPVHVPAPAPARANAPARAPASPREDAAQAITLPAPALPRPAPPVAAASAPAGDLKFLDSTATRQAIRAVARGDTLASAGNAATREEPGSELVAADGTHAGMQRNLPIASSAVALSRGIDAAHKGDCGKGEYLGGGMGLLSAPFLLAAEAMGKCAPH